MPFYNSMTSQLIVLESCSNPQQTQQVFESAMKKIFGVSVFCEWYHKWCRFFHFGSYCLA